MGKRALIISITACAIAFIAAVVIYFKLSLDSDSMFSEKDNANANITGVGMTGLIMPDASSRSSSSSSQASLPLPYVSDIPKPSNNTNSESTDTSKHDLIRLDEDDFYFEYSAPDDDWLNDLDGIDNALAFPDGINNEQQSSVSEPQTIEPEPEDAPSSLLYDYKNKWAYSRLDRKLKQVYELIYKAAESNTDLIGLAEYSLTEEELGKAYWAFDYDNPQFLRLGSGYGYTVQSHKIVSMNIQYGRTTVPQSQFDTMANNVINSARQYNDDYSRIKYIHDWIINNTRYLVTNEKFSSEADGPVVSGSAICEGYSKAFMYFCQALEIPCVCVGGYANGEGHMWNKVQLGGKWYNIDVTWDDPVTSNGENLLRYDYFLKSDQTLNADHSVDNPFPLPQASSDYTA